MHPDDKDESAAPPPRSPALEKLERFQGPWAGDIDRVFADYSY